MTRIDFAFSVGDVVTTIHGEKAEVSSLMWDGATQCSLRLPSGKVEWWSEQNLTRWVEPERLQCEQEDKEVVR